MTHDSFIFYLLYVPQHEKKLKLDEKKVFVKYQGRTWFIDKDNIYFYSDLDLDLPSTNVGNISNKIRRYELPIDIRTFQVIENAETWQGMTALYDKNKAKYFLKYKESPINFVLNGYEVGDEIKRLEQLEQYEMCAALKKIENFNTWKQELFLK